MYSNAAMAESAALRSADSISRTALSSEKDREQEKSCGRRGEEITADASSDDGHESNSSVSSSLLDNADPSALDGGSAHKIKKDADGKQPTFSLREKSRIPVGMYLSFACILSLLYSSGIVTHFDVIMGGLSSSLHLSQGVQSTVQGIVDLFFGSACAAACWVERTQALLMTGVAGSVAYVLLYIPFRAGFWTGLRASRHKVHRYMGLSFLILYAVAWLEFVSDYEGGASRSFLPLAIALNGFTQAASAYFTFKVLPKLTDPGFFSDKAVLSRNFVFENAFYQLFTVFGSVYYNDFLRDNMRSSLLGKAIEILFCFFSYVVLRPFFPTTRMMNAGTSRFGRSKDNEGFYKIGTTMVKIFYLWAKYFLGFFINWLVFLNVQSQQDMYLIRGLFLLNVGTTSIAIFLHTLRFKKVLPPKIAFSIYLAMIYLTFCAVPYAYAMFTSHVKLATVTLLGIICNMTRNSKIHAVWCVVSLYLMTALDLQW